jgi:hypothetical protein
MYGFHYTVHVRKKWNRALMSSSLVSNTDFYVNEFESQLQNVSATCTRTLV